MISLAPWWAVLRISGLDGGRPRLFRLCGCNGNRSNHLIRQRLIDHSLIFFHHITKCQYSVNLRRSAERTAPACAMSHFNLYYQSPTTLADLSHTCAARVAAERVAQLDSGVDTLAWEENHYLTVLFLCPSSQPKLEKIVTVDDTVEAPHATLGACNLNEFSGLGTSTCGSVLATRGCR